MLTLYIELRAKNVKNVFFTSTHLVTVGVQHAVTVVLRVHVEGQRLTALDTDARTCHVAVT